MQTYSSEHSRTLNQRTERKQKEKEEQGLISVILLAVTRRKGAKSLRKGLRLPGRVREPIKKRIAYTPRKLLKDWPTTPLRGLCLKLIELGWVRTPSFYSIEVPIANKR